MADNQASHITVSYKDNIQGAEITYIFAISKDISRELEQHEKKPTGKDLVAWLDDKGCKLDCSDGPAQVRRESDNSTYEYCYKNNDAGVCRPALREIG